MKETITVTYHVIDKRIGYHRSVVLADLTVDRLSRWHPSMLIDHNGSGLHGRGLRIALHNACKAIVHAMEDVEFADKKPSHTEPGLCSRCNDYDPHLEDGMCPVCVETGGR